jgi:hypothetical protein
MKFCLILFFSLGLTLLNGQYQKASLNEESIIQIETLNVDVPKKIEQRSITPSQMQGFPKALPANTTFKNFRNVTLADLNGNGKNEIIVGVNNKLYIFDQEQLIWEKDLIGVAIYPPSVADLNKDGIPEIVLATGGTQAGRLYVVDRKGIDLPNFPKNFNNNWILSAPTLSDLDDDGILEIVVCERVSPAGRLQVLRLDGTSFPNFPITLDRTPAVTPSVADIDADGKKDIVVASTGSLYAFELNGSLKSGFPITNPDLRYSYQSPILVDLDEDGQKEIIGAGHGNRPEFYVRKATGDYLANWSKSVPNNNWTYTTPTVITWNGKKITLMSRPIGVDEDEMLYAWDASGELLPNFPIVKSGGLEGLITVADVNDDGKPDLIFGSNLHDASSGKGFIHAYSLETATEIEGFPIRPQGWTYMNGATIGDVNGDGLMDLVALSYTQRFGTAPDTAFLNVYELNVPISSERVWWSTYKGSNTRTGAIEEEAISDVQHQVSENATIWIFPNPVKDILQIQHTDSQLFDVAIFNLLGQTMLWAKQTNMLEIQHLPNGIYFLWLPKYKQTVKFVIHH